MAGLGIEITVKGGILTVVSPIEDTPAAKAGIKPGDQIFKIEEEFTKDMSLVDAVKKMRGLKGTKINLTIKREGAADLIDFTLVRDIIRVQSVSSRILEPGYGYIRLAQFQERSDRDMQRALEKLAAEKGGIKGLVLDLRNNPGGLLTQAVRVSDLFLESGLIVYTEGRIERRSKNILPKKTAPGWIFRSWFWSTAAAPARRRSSPALCRTTSARWCSARKLSAKARCRRFCRWMTTRRCA